MSPADCATCGELPDEFRAETGRDEHLPAAAYRLVSITSAGGRGLRRCPDCDALFDFDEYVAFTGSGVNDDERLNRLGGRKAAPVRALLGLTPDRTDAPQLFVDALTGLPIGLAQVVLRELISIAAPEAFALVVPDLVACLVRNGDEFYTDLLKAHAGQDRGRKARILRLLLEDPRPKGHWARHLTEHFTPSPS